MLCLTYTVIRTAFGDEGHAFYSGPMMAVEQTWTLYVPRARSSLQTSDCSSQKHNLVPHSPPRFAWSRQLGKEKGVYTTILLTTSQKQQQQEHEVPSPQCLSMQYLYIVKLDGVPQEAGQELEHVMWVRRGWRRRNRLVQPAKGQAEGRTGCTLLPLVGERL